MFAADVFVVDDFAFTGVTGVDDCDFVAVAVEFVVDLVLLLRFFLLLLLLLLEFKPDCSDPKPIDPNSSDSNRIWNWVKPLSQIGFQIFQFWIETDPISPLNM